MGSDEGEVGVMRDVGRCEESVGRCMKYKEEGRGTLEE